jgi:hypothetical protein
MKEKTKHRLLITTFVISVACAVSGLGLGAYFYIKSKAPSSGWNSVTMTTSNKYINFGENIVLNYYLDDNHASSTYLTNIRNTFTKAGLYYASLLNPYFSNEEYIGIYYINEHPFEKIKITEDLYQILDDAYQKTMQENSSYSLFSGLLYQYWSDALINTEEDPLVADQDAINDLVAISNLDNYHLDLSFEDDAYYVELSYSDQVISFIEDQGYDNTILNLNVLYDSYFMQLVADDLIKNNFSYGYLYSYTGEYIFLSDAFSSKNQIAIKSINNQYQVIDGGYLSFNGKGVGSIIRSFPVTNYEYTNNYLLISSKNNKSIYGLRYNYLTGYSSSDIHLSLLVDTAKNAKLYDVTYANFNAFNQAYKNYASLNDYLLVVIKDENNVYLNSLAQEGYVNEDATLLELNIDTMY